MVVIDAGEYLYCESCGCEHYLFATVCADCGGVLCDIPPASAPSTDARDHRTVEIPIGDLSEDQRVRLSWLLGSDDIPFEFRKAVAVVPSARQMEANEHLATLTTGPRSWPGPIPDEPSVAAARYAPVVGKRIVAGFIDLIPPTVVVVALSRRIHQGESHILVLTGWRLLAAFVIDLVYFFTAEALTSTTPGKRLVGLMVTCDGGARPGPGAIARRTVLRVVDGFPIFYFVGFVVMVVSPTRQRIGDLWAKTHVRSIRATTAERQSPAVTRRQSLVLAVLVAVTVVGAVLTTNLGRDSSAKVGSFSYETDVVAFVDSTVNDVFRELSSERLLSLFPDGAISAEEASQALVDLKQYTGRLVGEYTILDHQVTNDAEISGLGYHDAIELELHADFENGPGKIFLVIIATDKQLRLLSWHVNLTTD